MHVSKTKYVDAAFDAGLDVDQVQAMLLDTDKVVLERMHQDWSSKQKRKETKKRNLSAKSNGNSTGKTGDEDSKNEGPDTKPDDSVRGKNRHSKRLEG